MARILIVDDSLSMRRLVKGVLVDAGHDVLEAEDGLIALGLARTGGVDLVITDVNMPNMDGITLVGELRTLPSYRFTPILVLTTETDPEKKRDARAMGATGWIVKPFNPDQLLATTRKVLN